MADTHPGAAQDKGRDYIDLGKKATASKYTLSRVRDLRKTRKEENREKEYKRDIKDMK